MTIRNSIERYDILADAFYFETHIWPPGRSAPLDMGPASEAEWQTNYAVWTTWLRECASKILAEAETWARCEKCDQLIASNRRGRHADCEAQ